MPGRIHSTEISFSKLNDTKNIKKATASTTSSSSLAAMRDWYYNYAGDVNGTVPATNTGIKMSDFGDTTVFGMQFYARNETASTYHDREDIGIAVKNFPLPPTGDESTYDIRLTGPASTAYNASYSNNVAPVVDSEITINHGAGDGGGTTTTTGRQASFDSTVVNGAGGARVTLEANVTLSEGSIGNDIELVGTGYDTPTSDPTSIEYISIFGTYATVTITSYTLSGGGTGGSVTITDTIQGAGNHNISPSPDGATSWSDLASTSWGGRYTVTGSSSEVPAALTVAVVGTVEATATMTVTMISDDHGAQPANGENNGWTTPTSTEQTFDQWLGGYQVDFEGGDSETGWPYWDRTVTAGQTIGPLANGATPYTVTELVTLFNAAEPILAINTSIVGGSVTPSPGELLTFTGGLDVGDVIPGSPGSIVAWAYYGRDDGMGHASWDGSLLSDGTTYNIKCTHNATDTSFNVDLIMGYTTGTATVTGPESGVVRNMEWGGSSTGSGGLNSSWTDLFYTYINTEDSAGRSYGAYLGGQNP